jgi:tetratricopeptide (TPR) repeat protein
MKNSLCKPGISMLLLLAALLLLVAPAAAQGINARNLVKLARSSADNKDWAKARDYATQALQEEGGYMDAYYVRAFANRMLGDKKKAEEDFREVIRREPDYLPTYGALADMYIADKEWDKAEKVFNELGAQNDGAKWASYYRGVVAYTRGDLKKAEAQWRDALAKDVNFASASHNLGAVCLARKEYARALTYFTDALEQKQESAMYRFHVAWALEKTGQVPKALDALKRIMNENSDDQRFWLLARAYDQVLRNQNETALKVLETVNKENPDLLDGWVLKARASLATGKPEDAREALEKAKELDSQFAEVNDLMAKLPPKPMPGGDGKAPAPPSDGKSPTSPSDSGALPPTSAPAASPPVREKPPQPGE